MTFGLDCFAQLPVECLDRSCNRYERAQMRPVTGDRLDAGGVRVGEYGATVRDRGIREQAQAGQAVHIRCASSACLYLAAPATHPDALRARIRSCRLPA